MVRDFDQESKYASRIFCIEVPVHRYFGPKVLNLRIKVSGISGLWHSIDSPADINTSKGPGSCHSDIVLHTEVRPINSIFSEKAAELF